VTYSITFTVPGKTELAAIANAVSMLRSNVTLRGVLKVQATAGPYWDVTLSVHEDV
jgi:hypothetical protein